MAAEQVILGLDYLVAAITAAQQRLSVGPVAAEYGRGWSDNGQLPVPVPDQIPRRLFCASIDSAYDASTASGALGTDQVCLKYSDLVPAFADVSHHLSE